MKNYKNAAIYLLCTLLSSVASYYVIHDMEKIDGTITTLSEAICVSISFGIIGACIAWFIVSDDDSSGGASGMGDFPGGLGGAI